MLMILISGLMCLAAMGLIDHSIQALGMDAVTTSNAAYLKASFDQATSGFIILSGIKSGLAVIEGSAVGIGFNLEVGDIVQSVYDYVDIAWKTVLAGATVLLLTRLILETVPMFDHYFLFMTLFAFMLHLSVAWFLPEQSRLKRFFRDGAILLSVFSLTFYFVVPLSIQGAIYVSNQISQPLIKEAQNDFKGVQESLSPENLNQQLFSLTSEETDAWYLRFDFGKNYQILKQGLERFKSHVKEKTEEIAVFTIKLTAGYLFDCILLPIVFLVVLLFGITGMTRYFLSLCP